MSSRKVTLLLVAAVVALGTVFTVRGLMAPGAPAPASPQAVVQTTEIAAAARDLPRFNRQPHFRHAAFPIGNPRMQRREALFCRSRMRLRNSRMFVRGISISFNSKGDGTPQSFTFVSSIIISRGHSRQFAILGSDSGVSASASPTVHLEEGVSIAIADPTRASLSVRRRPSSWRSRAPVFLWQQSHSK